MTSKLKRFLSSLFEKSDKMSDNLCSIESKILIFKCEMKLIFVPRINSVTGKEGDNLIVIKCKIMIPWNL